jgi:protein SCO1/2
MTALAILAEHYFMNAAPKSLQRMVWGAIALTITSIVVVFVVQQQRKVASTAVGDRDDPAAKLEILFDVPDFALTNQNAEVIRRADLRGQIWIADIIFTRCAGPCPEMTRRMAELQAALPAELPVKFVTLTADPVHDTPEVLRAYGRRFGVESGRWHLLTGPKQEIVDLAVRGLKLTAIEKEQDQQENVNDLFIHSTLFVILDQQGRARAIIESDDVEMKPKVLRAVNQLLGVN